MHVCFHSSLYLIFYVDSFFSPCVQVGRNAGLCFLLLFFIPFFFLCLFLSFLFLAIEQISYSTTGIRFTLCTANRTVQGVFTRVLPLPELLWVLQHFCNPTRASASSATQFKPYSEFCEFFKYTLERVRVGLQHYRPYPKFFGFCSTSVTLSGASVSSVTHFKP